MSLQWVSMFFWLFLTFCNSFFCCSVSPLFKDLLCLAVRCCISSFKLIFFNWSVVFPLKVNSFFAIFTSYACLFFSALFFRLYALEVNFLKIGLVSPLHASSCRQMGGSRSSLRCRSLSATSCFLLSKRVFPCGLSRRLCLSLPCIPAKRFFFCLMGVLSQYLLVFW